MNKFEAWFKAFRLRTLPLSFSSVILGSMLALHKGVFHGYVLAWALVTTLFLQILSNLANDYGDAVNGVDNEHRSGPVRAVQSGAITPTEMKAGIAVSAALALASGIWLLIKASRHLEQSTLLIFFLVGLLAIGAAMKYTIGRNPYGYIGLGDVAVFLFFGITGVAGTFYLHTNTLHWHELLPAASLGLLATGVLNLNNLRDEESDRMAGKRSIVVMLGGKKGRVYHSMLIGSAIALALLYTALNFRSGYQLLFLVSLPLLLQNMWVVNRTQLSSELDGELKKLAFATLIFSITMGLGLIY